MGQALPFLAFMQSFNMAFANISDIIIVVVRLSRRTKYNNFYHVAAFSEVQYACPRGVRCVSTIIIVVWRVVAAGGFGSWGSLDVEIMVPPNENTPKPALSFPQIRVVAGETETAVNWAEMDFRLSKVRDGSHKDCWLMERAIIRDSGYDAK